jgi:hypothetical protein
VTPASGTFSQIVDYANGRGPKPSPAEAASAYREMLGAATPARCRRNADITTLLQAR